jgi:hypothetical protein
LGSAGTVLFEQVIGRRDDLCFLGSFVQKTTSRSGLERIGWVASVNEV